MSRHHVSSSYNEQVELSLDKHLAELDEVDRKLIEVLNLIKEIISNLEKDKQISKNKMDEIVKKFTRTLEDDIYRVVNEQLNYMENLCVGSEHQGSSFKLQNHRDASRLKLKHMHDELISLMTSYQYAPSDSPPPSLLKKENESGQDEILSGTSDDVFE